MKKVLGRLTFGGLQKKLMALVLAIMLMAVGVFYIIFNFQNNMLIELVNGTKTEQEESISRISGDTMYQMMRSFLVSSTDQMAQIADSDFSEVVREVSIMKTMAESLLMNKATVTPAVFGLPDPAKDGTISEMVLHAEGVDYENSEYLKAIAHLGMPMAAMVENSSMINAAYIGLKDGTDFLADTETLDKYDENGDLIPFPVTERPWYVGAVEAGDIYFTGIEPDAFTGELTITCSAPILEKGEIVGVAGVDIILASMDEFIDSAIERGGFAFIVNEKGQVVFSPDDNELFNAEVSLKAEDLRKSENSDLAALIKTALVAPTGLQQVSIEGKVYYMDRLMSAYRMNAAGSLSAAYKADKELLKRRALDFCEMLDRLNEYSEHRYDAVIRKYREKKLFDMYAVLGDRANMLRHISAYADKPLKIRAAVRLRSCFPKLANRLADTWRRIGGRRG